MDGREEWSISNSIENDTGVQFKNMSDTVIQFGVQKNNHLYLHLNVSDFPLNTLIDVEHISGFWCLKLIKQ